MLLLSSLAKDILLQAEIETTAEKLSAGPLARVAFNILSIVPDFSQVFFAKLVQRVGGWPIPFSIPNHDHDGRKWANVDEQKKINGFRKNKETDSYEAEADLIPRVTGIMGFTSQFSEYANERTTTDAVSAPEILDLVCQNAWRTCVAGEDYYCAIDV